MPRPEGSSESSGLKKSQDESGAPTDRTSVDNLKKSQDQMTKRIDRMDQRFNEGIERMNDHFDRIDKRFNEIIDLMDKCLMEQDQKSNETNEDLRRDSQSEALPGQHARPEGEDSHSEESGELKDDSTADGEERVTPFENQPEKDSTHRPAGNDLALFSRPIESDEDKDFCPCESTPRDPPHGVSLDEEPVRKSAGSNNSEKSVERDEATSTSPNEHQGRRFSFQVATANATKKNYGVIRNQFVLRNKTVSTTRDENRFFGPGGKQGFCALTSSPIPL